MRIQTQFALAFTLPALTFSAHGQLLYGLWSDSQRPTAFARVLANGTDAEVVLFHTDDPQKSTTVFTNHSGIRGVERVDRGIDTELFFISGYDSGNSTGFLEYVDHTSYVFGSATIIYTNADQVAGSAYSESRGELYIYHPAQSKLFSAAFDPNNPSTPPSWKQHLLDLSALNDPNESILMRVSDDPANGFLMAINPGDPSEEELEILIDPQGILSQSVIPAMLRKPVPLGYALEQESTLQVEGDPLTNLDVYLARSGTVLGSGTTNSQGFATISLASLQAGDIVGVRLAGTSDESIRREYAFLTHGVSETSSNGLTSGVFGESEATRAHVNDLDWGVGFLGEGPNNGQKGTYQAWLLVGTEPEIVEDPGVPGRFVLAGPNVVSIPRTLYKKKQGRVFGRVPIPLPDDPAYANQRISLQWLVVDGQEFVFTNVATISIQPDLWMPPGQGPSQSRVSSSDSGYSTSGGRGAPKIDPVLVRNWAIKLGKGRPFYFGKNNGSGK